MNEQELEQLRAQKAQKALEEAKKRAVQEEQIRSAIAQLLMPQAYERLMFVRQNNPELFAKAVQMIAYLRQSGKMRGRMGEGQLKEMLVKLGGKKRETKITFRRKGGEIEE
ncbi:MAG: DNA-binding protein [Candidatus Micrarchaeota archaeon]